jgi:hypothetical protein
LVLFEPSPEAAVVPREELPRVLSD